MKRVTRKTAACRKMTVKEKAQVFKALSHVTRLQIVQRLAKGEACVCDLLEMFDIDMSTLSRHLSVLRNAGLVFDEKRGKNVFYDLTCPCILDLFDCMEEAMCQRRYG